MWNIHVILVSLLFFVAVDAIRCYRCIHNEQGTSHAGCEGPVVDSSHLDTCPSGLARCSKSLTTVRAGTGSVTSILRGCTNVTTNGCTTTAEREVTTCICDTDGCNSSCNMKTNLALVISLVLLGNLALRT